MKDPWLIMLTGYWCTCSANKKYEQKSEEQQLHCSRNKNPFSLAFFQSEKQIALSVLNTSSSLPFLFCCCCHLNIFSCTKQKRKFIFFRCRAEYVGMAVSSRGWLKVQWRDKVRKLYGSKAATAGSGQQLGSIEGGAFPCDAHHSGNSVWMVLYSVTFLAAQGRLPSHSTPSSYAAEYGPS